MAPIKRSITSVPEDNSDPEAESSSQSSDISQTFSVSPATFYAVGLMT